MDSDSNRKKCKKICRFCNAFRLITETKGECRREIPQTIVNHHDDGEPDLWGYWPLVSPDDWCNDFTHEKGGGF